MQAARAFKRNRPVDFEGFDFKGGYGPPPTNGTAWLLSTAGVGDEYYDDYDDNYEDGPPIPDQWDTMEPKYVNDRRVLINKQIESSSLRVQGMDKEDMGVMATDEARQIAREEGVDLVMISPDANPPLARLISFSKFKYEAERATKQRQKASKGVDLKELRLRPVTETHDYAVKLKQAQGFLQKGSKVKVSMAFSGRELRFKDQGKELILRFVEDLTSVGKVDGAINFKTSNFSVTMAPNK
ncbi:Translation initiation factor IF-3 [Monoraphidium neglectum]|uniref:Translation initiation factor IF-3 n=1 Tax=Monoraphidium neglectum TaxID=145388 RepID=A0A0D2N5D4_9CHLO|nr:Translation initiation factor IF-3 [Monoraphidium neglectum]KIZ07507.1 Translation initiation factor IF-3 [Monoraphidium neglectum]|eukprot:XP_013906526.1 Translation initiation factor IF-3 [Monoraphidium neglectum]